MTQDQHGQTDGRDGVIAPNATAPDDDANHDVLAGGGQLGARMRVTEWSATALGPISTWPQSLRSALSICIGSRFPIAIYWGRELALLYNDAWRLILGEKP